MFRWDNSFSIGNTTIDEQHQRLLALIADLDELNEDANEELLAQILDYSEYHFKAEEQLMQSTGYPDASTHSNKHKELNNTLNTHLNDYAANRINLFAFKNFLYFWVRDHIMEDDQKFGHFLAGF